MNGNLGEVSTVLNRPYHLSYPFVFHFGGHAYMIPESRANRTIDLYKASEFPYKWTFEKTLFRVKAVDTTLLIEDALWFFTTILAPHGDGCCLCLFFADSLAGEWQSHPGNPIFLDVRNARSGGRISRRGSKLYRISQSGVPQYGGSFSFYEILTLTRLEYSEILIKTVHPWPPNRGIHFYDYSGR